MKTYIMSIIVGVLFIIGCARPATLPDIPNFRAVDATQTIYRGGQPNTNGFIYLKSIGISNIVKLNVESEGSDRFVKTLGMHMVYVPINKTEQLLGPLPHWKVNLAYSGIKPGTYVHCEHGQDRTGLIVAVYRMHRGMSKEDAKKEMLADGFHKVLHGLWDYFEDLP